jgi:hypothetical protein
METNIRKKYLKQQSKLFQIMVYLGMFKFWVEEQQGGFSNYPWICRKLRLWHPFVIIIFPFILIVKIFKTIVESFITFINEGKIVKYH